MIKTRFTELVGVEHPIVQGGMQWVGRAELVAAVANAGALGFITALTQPTPEDLHQGDRALPRPDRQAVRREPDHPARRSSRRPTPNTARPSSRAASRSSRPPATSRRSTSTEFKKHGIKVVHKCTSVRHALSAERMGVDAISIDGFECAGHPGEDDTPGLILIPAAADKVKIPMIASGGFGDGRGLVAALALGAEGINMGTRFMCTKESPIHQLIKEKIVANDERETELIFRTMRNTSRVAKNAISHQGRRDGEGRRQVRGRPRSRGRRARQDGLCHRRCRRRHLVGRPGAGPDPRHPDLRRAGLAHHARGRSDHPRPARGHDVRRASAKPRNKRLHRTNEE